MSYLLTGETTERLLFREVNNNDVEKWIPYFDDPESGKFGNWPHDSSRENSLHLINTILERYKKDNGLMALVERKSGNLIGMCGLLIQQLEGNQLIEIGYHILPTERKKGYATEAAVKCRQFAFEHKLAAYVVSIIHIENMNSKKVARNNSMKLERLAEWRGNTVEIYRTDAPLNGTSPGL